jgi:TonB family protein
VATSQKHPWLRRLPLLIGMVLVIAVAVAIFYFRDLFQKAPSTKRTIQQITVVQPPPPPPPPPEQKLPEPEVKEEKIEEPEPEPEQQPEPEAPEAPEAPPGDQLGVDSDGGAGSDAFGLQGRKGGRSLTEGAGGHRIGGSVIHWYGGQIKRTLEDELHSLLADTHARKNIYMVVLSIWITPEGRLARAELSSSSGKAEVDQTIRQALPKLRLEMSKPPPPGMPQPVKIRVHSR